MDVSAEVNPTDLFSASGLTIVITGGGTGLGQAMLSAVVKTGAAKVYILGRRLEALQKAASAIDSSGSVIACKQCDVANPDSVANVVRAIEGEVDHVDVIINNAGVSGPDHRPLYQAKSLREVQSALLGPSADSWATTFAINSSAPAIVSAAFLHLLEKGNAKRGWETGKMEPGGRARKRVEVEGVDSKDVRTSQIITIASIAAYARIITAGLPYIGSKAAVVAMGKSMANFLAPWGIRVNTICPGGE
jgi:NAD(P)-dependent dehydrogenase (short-subunit alcohol dehydrogenase family)